MRPRFSTILLFTLFVCMPVIMTRAQEEFGYRNSFACITMESGLLNNFIDFIYKDSRGFIWVATNGGGLSRYDGYEFVHYDLNTSKEKLRSNFINDCCEDAFGRLWVTSREGIDILDLSTSRIITLSDPQGIHPPFFQQSASCVKADSQGNVWGYCNNTLYKIAFDKQGDILRYDSLQSVLPDFPNKVIEDLDGDGEVWTAIGSQICKIRADEKGLHAVPVSPKLEFHQDVRIRALLQKEKEIWIGTEVGLVRYNRNEDILKWYGYDGTSRGMTQSFVTDLAVNGEKQLLVSTYKGLNVYNPVTDDFEQIMLHADGVSGGLNSNFINCMMVDGDITWLGTETGGLNKVIPKNLYVRSYVHNDRDPHSLLPNPVNVIFEDDRENLWVGMVEGGLSLKKKGSDSFLNFTHENCGLSHNSVNSLAQDNNNRLWVGTWGGGITVFDMETLKIQKHIFITRHFPIYFISSLYYDAINDLMWIGTDWGIYYYDIKTDRIHSPFEGEELDSQIHKSLGGAIDPSGKLWMGCQVGVFVFDLHAREDDKFRYVHLKYKLDDPASRLTERISCLLLDADSVLWLGSNGNGLFRHIPAKDGGIGHFVNYTTQHGLISNIVCGILQDERKRLWISTNNGLSCFDPARDEFTNFKRDDGLPEDSFYWNAYSHSKSGLLYFGGISGLYAIDPQQLNRRSRHTNVVLTKLSVMNEQIRPGKSYIDTDISIAKTIRLHERDKSFSLEFASLNYDSPATARYSYRLKGFDGKWINVPVTRRFASYTNLPAGEYTFQVKYSVDGRDTDSPVTEICIKVKPFFYKTPGFISLAVVLAICLVVYLYLRRVNALQRQKQHLHQTVEERTHELKEQNKTLVYMSEKIQGLTADKIAFFTNITHEFRTPVTLIIGPIERALKLSRNPLVLEQLNFVERNSKYLLSLINQLMDFRKVESGNLKVVKNMGDFKKFVPIVIKPFEALARNRGVSLNLYMRIDSPEFLFDQDAMQKVIINLLGNAMKFTPDGGKISLYAASIKDARSRQTLLYMCVRDTGTGIPEEDMEQIFNRFYQSKNDVEHPVYGQSGTGIGLYLCKRIVGQLEGTIYAVNNKRAGSSFRMLIPLQYEVRETGSEPSEQHKEEGELSATRQPPGFVAGKLTILVVEDNEDMRGFIRSILTERFNVVEAGNGQEALDVLHRNHVDFIISDLMMPVMDGVEFSRKVRENFSISHIPILMLTAKTSQESRIESYKTGVDAYLSKPFNEELLLARIGNILEIRRRYHEQFAQNMDIAELNMEEESKEKKFVNKALKIIHENYKNPAYEAGDFAEAMGVSKNLLNEKLHTLTGQTTNQFIRNCRLNIARELIEKNKVTHNLNISEIAYEVGFNDPKYFTRCFTKRFNITPSNLLNNEGG